MGYSPWGCKESDMTERRAYTRTQTRMRKMIWSNGVALAPPFTGNTVMKNAVWPARG